MKLIDGVSEEAYEVLHTAGWAPSAMLPNMRLELGDAARGLVLTALSSVNLTYISEGFTGRA
jgi:hypothetical protein